MARPSKLRSCSSLLIFTPTFFILYLSLVGHIDDKVVRVSNGSASAPQLKSTLQARTLRLVPDSNNTENIEVVIAKRQTTISTPITTEYTPSYTHVIENEYQNPLMTICEAYEGRRPIANSESYGPFNRTETYENCRDTCRRHDKTYATLTRGVCQCFDVDSSNKALIDLEYCNATCTDQQPDCITRFKTQAITMRTSLRDGNKDWTPWMNMKELGLRVRYRGCPRAREGVTECKPEYQREKTASTAFATQIISKYIGCFTARSVVSALSGTTFHQVYYQHKKYKDELNFYITKDKMHRLCIKFCDIHKSTYALLSTQLSPEANRTCHCADNLLQSRPTDTCRGLGYSVYWMPENETVTLKFTGETKKKGKVLVLGRYRSGSSMTQSFFSRYPGSLTIFEPCKVMYFDPIQRPTDKAMLTALESFYSCDVNKLPLLFYSTSFVQWSSNMLRQRGADNNYMSDVIKCFQMEPKSDCAPFWLEACQRSEFLNVKVIRLFSVPTIREFIERNKDVHVVHLVRDPRALLSAQKLYGTKDPPDQVCTQMVEAGRMVREMKARRVPNVHEVFYEELAVNATRYGAIIYDEMQIRMPKEVEAFLSREDIQNMEAVPKSISEVVVMDDPKYHVYRFLERYTLDDILKIDGNCTNVYRFWSRHYTDFNTLIKRHGEEMEKFISEKRPLIAQYLRKKRKSPG